MKKSELPQKICPVCNLAFTWRKKWEKNWLDVGCRMSVVGCRMLDVGKKCE